MLHFFQISIFFCPVLREEREQVVLSSIAIVRPNTDAVSPEYLTYFLKSSRVKEEMAIFLSGAAIPRIVLSDFKKVKVKVPPLPVQRRIAQVLGRYDALIENYAAQIRYLEATAQNLYAEWFVRGRCPFAEYETGAKLPIGWEVKSFSEIAFFENGFPFTPTDWGNKGLPIIKINELRNGIQSDTPYNNGTNVPKKYWISNGDILFSWSAFLDIFHWTEGDALLNQHIFKVTPKAGLDNKYYIYFALKNSITEFRNLSNGATMQHIKKSALDTTKCEFPPQKIIDAFTKMIKPMFIKNENLQMQITKLRRMRDKLLPRLLSGKLPVKVSESEKLSLQI